MPYLDVNFLLILVSSHRTKLEDNIMFKALMVISERFPIGVETIYKPESIFFSLSLSLTKFISKLFIYSSLKNNIIIFIIFVSLILVGCETTQVQTKTNIIKTPQSSENILKKDKTESQKIVENPVSKSNPETNTEITKQPLKVGIMLPLTGKHYQIGNSLLNAAQLALNKTQSKNIKFFVRDTGNTDNITKNFYSLLNQDIDIILGPIFSENILKIKPLVKDEDIQIITFSNNTEVKQNNLYIFGLTLEDEMQSILRYSQNSKNKKLAAILPDNDYGKRIKTEITKFYTNNPSHLVKTIMYNPNNPDFYKISKNISEYEDRKINLALKIKELESHNTDKSKKEVKRLKNLDTLGDLPFDSLFIGIQTFNQLSMISSILPYYDVDPKKIQYLGNSVWNQDSIVKEPGLNNSVFTSLDRESISHFKQEYIKIFNQKPHPIASLAYDAVGLIVSLSKNQKTINSSSLTSKKGFVGVSGKFKFKLDGNIERIPIIYRVKDENLYEINN